MESPTGCKQAPEIPSELLPALTALWLGILTSFSPCPLATNVAAVGWLAGAGATPSRTVGAGVLYSLGRALSYSLLGGLLTASLLSAVGTARFLQHDLNRVLGPLLIVAGMVLLDLLPIRMPTIDLQSKGRRIVMHGKGLGALLLGALFALSFSPVSVGLFFGSLLPARESDGHVLATFWLQHQDGLLLPRTPSDSLAKK